MNNYFIKKQDFADFINEISSDFRAFYLKDKPTQFDWKKGQRKILCWQEYNGDLEGLVVGDIRAQDPLKQFIFAAQEVVSRDFNSPKRNQKPLLLIGAKNCDLTGLDVTDFVFMQGDFQDPFYIDRREQMFIISSDCTNPPETCFCLALDIKPYPEKNYDLGICDVGEGYVLESVSQKAEKYISKHKSKFNPVTTAQLQRRDITRNNTINDLKVSIAKNNIPSKPQLNGVMKKGFESPLWKEEIKTCVECGCCNFICPTCHCFFLGDSKQQNKDTRHKFWDACLYKDFAQVAGGANPRKKLYQRLRNRYEKKFEFFPNVLGKIACTGCGRCITGCPAKIDIRRILKNLVKEASA